jgi:predicted alpha/beta hydrolase
VQETFHTIPSRDGFLLSAILLEPDNSSKGVILLSGGTGIKKEFYLNFARYVCEQGYVVCLFDYRGIGGSRPVSLRGFNAHNHEWGQKDMAAMLDWLDSKWVALPRFLIGHSAGGQQLGFMNNHHKFSKALLISSSTGYWRWLSSPYKYFTLFVWYVLAPITNNTLGYVPASWFGLGEDLPKGVASEWRSWCLRQNYFADFLGNQIPEHYFHEVKIPVHFVFPEDDTIATDRTVKTLREFYPSAATTTEKILLKDYQLKQVGHLGFFSRKVKDKLWGKAIEFLEQ